MTAEQERSRQVRAFNQALQLAYDLEISIVMVTPHMAQCVVHHIEELEERLCVAREKLPEGKDKEGIKK